MWKNVVWIRGKCGTECYAEENTKKMKSNKRREMLREDEKD
jgi:hypothetical protein